MDYYSTLGVPKNASQDEIKKAYKKQSMKHHPDRGGDEAQFKRINEAYQTLGDAQKRAAYDNPQPQFNFNTSNMGGGFEDIFNGFGFGGFHHRQQRNRNRDIQLQYTLELADCFTGRGITLRYNLPSGREELVDVHIPPGCKDNDVVRIPAYGDDSIAHFARGDLLLRIRVRQHKNWILDNNDLVYTIQLNILELLIGVEKEITTPENRVISLKIPQGTNPGTTFSVTGYGIPDSRTGQRGKLFVKVKGKTPRITDPTLIEQLKEIHKKVP